MKPGSVDLLKFAETLQDHQIHLPMHLNTALHRPPITTGVPKSAVSTHPLLSPIKSMHPDEISEAPLSKTNHIESVEYSDYDNGQRPWRPPLKKHVRADSSSLMSHLFAAASTDDQENMRPTQPEPRRRASLGNAVEMNVLYSQAHVDDAVNEQHPDKLIEMIENLENDTDDIFEQATFIDAPTDDTPSSETASPQQVISLSHC
jgi:hypothetical protein